MCITEGCMAVAKNETRGESDVSLAIVVRNMMILVFPFSVVDYPSWNLVSMICH